MPSQAEVIRVTLRYSASQAAIVEAKPIHGPAAFDDWRAASDSSGAWLELKKPDGKVAFAQPLPDPFAGREVFADDEYLPAASDHPPES